MAELSDLVVNVKVNTTGGIENQETVVAWHTKTFKKERAPKYIAGLHDSISTLMYAALSARRKKAKRQEIAGCCAEILKELYQVAHAYKFDLHEALDLRMAHDRTVDWTHDAHDQFGTPKGMKVYVKPEKIAAKNDLKEITPAPQVELIHVEDPTG